MKATARIIETNEVTLDYKATSLGGNYSFSIYCDMGYTKRELLDKLANSLCGESEYYQIEAGLGDEMEWAEEAESKIEKHIEENYQIVSFVCSEERKKELLVFDITTLRKWNFPEKSLLELLESGCKSEDYISNVFSRTFERYVEKNLSKKILKVVNHDLTEDQINDLDGLEVVELPETISNSLKNCSSDIGILTSLAQAVIKTANDNDIKNIIVPAGSPAFMAILSRITQGYFTLWFSHSIRDFKEIKKDNGSIEKINIFRHIEFIKI